MFRKFALGPFSVGVAVLALAAAGHLPNAGQARAATRTGPLITQAIDESRLIAPAGNIRPEANAANDRGLAPDDLAMDHVLLQLQRSPERERAFEERIAALHDPASPHYHRWLTPAQIGAAYGPDPKDIATVTGWLGARGFRVNHVYPNGMVIDFSGTAGQVRAAFRTEIHRLEVAGKPHLANMSDPQIPAALAPVVAGIVTLNDFPRHAAHLRHPGFTFSCGTTTCQAVAPADLATIYSLNPLFKTGITGKGQTVAVINDSNIGSASDWTTFRSSYGLSAHSGTFAQTHPAPHSGPTNCLNPGVNADEAEATIDAEWSGAAAPDAHIELATCADTNTIDGLLTAVLNLTQESAATRPQIISISYIECEAFQGAAHNAAYNSAFQTAVAEGISVFVATGDWLAAVCDANDPPPAASVFGIAVNGIGATQYNVAVGGTDFGDVLAGTASSYWSATNGATFGSAKSYIPEIPWNGSCASEPVAARLHFATTYGVKGLCNSPTSKTYGLNEVSGASGGPSRCATGSPSTAGVVSGSCAGYPTPSWQKGVLGLPANPVRNLPDVSLFSANWPWGHSYIMCDTLQGGCLTGWGGTSFASPILAGIQALVNQKMGATHGEGNPNVVYYKLAAKEYASATALAHCNSSLGNKASSACVFYTVTRGDIDAPCQAGSPNCFSPSGAVGVLSVSNSAYEPAYVTGKGWDFATGIGTLNAYNLVAQWHTVAP
jgi:subtilase family serine protease